MSARSEHTEGVDPLILARAVVLTFLLLNPTLRPARGRPGRAVRVTTGHLFFRLTLAKLRYSSTRRPHAPGSTYGFNGGAERTPYPGQVPPANLLLGFHATRQSVST